MLNEPHVFPGSFEHIEAICELIDQAAKIAGFDDSTSYACQLAVGEACENIICHGYKDDDSGEIEVVLRAEPGELTIDLQDTARPFDPTSVPILEVKSGMENQVGGLGLPIIHRVMDEVEYSRHGRKNRLTMRKRCTSD
jgi:anti-sigma regulatory factor (Ser/Thr protein kinase)